VSVYYLYVCPDCEGSLI